jgi:hypothetical protein
MQPFDLNSLYLGGSGFGESLAATGAGEGSGVGAFARTDSGDGGTGATSPSTISMVKITMFCET